MVMSKNDRKWLVYLGFYGSAKPPGPGRHLGFADIQSQHQRLGQIDGPVDAMMFGAQDRFFIEEIEP
jgi:hypothetical protein